jgi:SagB-type dehydrogenase family enzyme
MHRSLRPGWRLIAGEGGAPTITDGERRVRLSTRTASMQRAVAAFADGRGVDAEAPALSAEGTLADWYYVVGSLERAGLVAYTTTGGLARLVPTGDRFTPPPTALGVDQRFTLSRFAFLHREKETLCAISGLSASRVELLTPTAIAFAGALARPTTANQLGSLGSAEQRDLLALFIAGEIVTAVRADGRTEEDTDPVRASWEMADALFHARRRFGRWDAPFGATPPFPTSEPPPVIAPARSPHTVALPTPNERDALDELLERRRSIREHDDTSSITIGELAELLHRSARVLDVRPPSQENPLGASRRLYPSGGACYALEVHPVVARCDGLTRGAYRYDPVAHQLEALAVDDDTITALMRDTGFDGGQYGARQVLLVITARFHRVMWKYRSIAYALIVEDLGVLYQTLALVGTDMGLAACALGAGHADRFARAIGADPLVESAVGEFMIGRAPRR